MNRVLWASVAHAFRRVALPLASYYAVTLALPLANGAAPSGAFIDHALVVLIVPPVAIMLACAVHTIAQALARLWNTTSSATPRAWPSAGSATQVSHSAVTPASWAKWFYLNKVVSSHIWS